MVPQPFSSVPNLSSMHFCCCAPPLPLARATWWGYKLWPWLLVPVLACPGDAAGPSPPWLLCPHLLGFFFLSVWRFCHCGWVSVLSWGSLSSLPSAQECTFSSAEPHGTLVELARELPQLISGLRKPSVVCHFFHPLFFSALRPFPSQ